MKKVLSIGLASMMMLGMFAGCKAPETTAAVEAPNRRP